MSWGIDLGGMLLQLGENLDREGLKETPQRVERAWAEFLEGYTLDPKAILGSTFEAEGTHPGIQVCQDISFTSMCEHHLLSFFGTATIVYQPDKRVAGLSKLARLVDCFARRLQIQERMTKQIADTLFEQLVPKGVLVVCKAKHLCCHGRGIRRNQMEFKTIAHCGEIDDFWSALRC